MAADDFGLILFKMQFINFFSSAVIDNVNILKINVKFQVPIFFLILATQQKSPT